MAEDYGVTLKIAADTSDLDKIPQKVEATSKEIAQPVTQTVKVEEQREAAAPVEHPDETVKVEEQREAAAPVEHPAETVEVREKRIVEEQGRERPAPEERTETVKVNVDQPEAVKVKVEQDPDPLKINISLPDPDEIESAIPKKDFHVDVQPKLDPSKLQAIPPIKVPVEAEKPAPVKIEAKADKIRVEVEDAEAKKRIEALTEKEGVKRIRVVTEGGELASRTGGKEIFELEVDAEKAKQTIADLKADARLKVTADTSQAVNGFNAMRAASAALHGNFVALGMEISKLGNGIGALRSIGVGTFSAIGAAVLSVVNLGISLRDLFATLFNVGSVGKEITSIGSALNGIKNSAVLFAEAMNEARKASELVNQSLEKEIAALGRVAKAQNEIERQRELSGAKNDKERDSINTKYDRQEIDIGANTARQTEELKRKGIVDEIARLEQEIEQSKKTQADYENQAAKARQRARMELPTNALTAAAEGFAKSFTGQATSNDKSLAASNASTDAQNAADDEAERRAQLEEELEKRRHDLKNADLEAEARKAEEVAAKAEEVAAKAKNEQDAATKAAQEEERKQKENAEKDKKQQNAQAAYTEERDRRTADADFDARFRAAQRRASAPDATEAQRKEAENTQIEMLRGKEDAAKAELEAAEKELAEEMAKDAKDRNEDRMSRARERAARAQGEQISAAQQRTKLANEIENRRVADAQDYFGNLARQVESSRPQNRLTAMGLGSGGPSDSTGREQVSLLKEIAKDFREAISAIRAQNHGDGTAVYAP